MKPQDADHLRILAICHYVYAAVKGLAILGGLLMLGLGGVVTLAEDVQAGSAIVIIGGIILCVAGVSVLLHLMCGKALSERRGHTFLTVMSILYCFDIPLGTLLGVFTLIVIHRDGVRESFDAPRTIAEGSSSRPSTDVG